MSIHKENQNFKFKFGELLIDFSWVFEPGSVIQDRLNSNGKVKTGESHGQQNPVNPTETGLQQRTGTLPSSEVSVSVEKVPAVQSGPQNTETDITNKSAATKTKLQFIKNSFSLTATETETETEKDPSSSERKGVLKRVVKHIENRGTAVGIVPQRSANDGEQRTPSRAAPQKSTVANEKQKEKQKEKRKEKQKLSVCCSPARSSENPKPQPQQRNSSAEADGAGRQPLRARRDGGRQKWSAARSLALGVSRTWEPLGAEQRTPQAHSADALQHTAAAADSPGTQLTFHSTDSTD